jgi:hypothetical protein
MFSDKSRSAIPYHLNGKGPRGCLWRDVPRAGAALAKWKAKADERVRLVIEEVE